MSVGETQNKLFEEAVSELETLDARLSERILTYLSEITTDGVLTPDSAQLAQIEQKIRQWTFELGYPEIVDNYLKGLEDVNEINKLYYEGNNRVKSAIENEIINSDLNNEYRKQVVETLRGAGAYEEIIKKVADVLRIDALRGLTFEQASNELRALVDPTEGKGIANRYFDQVARDALMSYDGLIQEELKKKFNPKEGRYLSSIIEESRPFCTHMKDTYGNRPISTTELQKELDAFCPNGNPSQTKVTYVTVNGEENTRKKGSGMIEGTRLENFPVNRGGYNCRHEWKWIF